MSPPFMPFALQRLMWLPSLIVGLPGVEWKGNRFQWMQRGLAMIHVSLSPCFLPPPSPQSDPYLASFPQFEL